MKRHSAAGFTLIEMIVSLVLVGILGVIATGFLTPLQINRRTAQEGQATNHARSYLELVKGRWLNTSTFATGSLPKVCAKTSTDTDCDLKMDTGWNVGVDATLVASWAATDTLRTVTVKASQGTYTYSFSTLISQP